MNWQKSEAILITKWKYWRQFTTTKKETGCGAIDECSDMEEADSTEENVGVAFHNTQDSTFVLSAHSQWAAVYLDNEFYSGQVVSVTLIIHLEKNIRCIQPLHD